jgi:hypothetical protein
MKILLRDLLEWCDQLRAEVAALKAERDRLRAALEEIADHHWSGNLPARNGIGFLGGH